MSDTLTFSIPSATSEGDPLRIFLHQAANADEDQGLSETNTGFVMWPSAVLLAHHLCKNPSLVLGDDGTPDGDVMELGAGCGLVGLTAATLLQNANDGNDDKVIFTDYNPVVLENLQKNIDLNDFDAYHKVLGLDWFDQEEHHEQQQKKQQQSDDGSDASGEDNANTWVDVEGKEHAQVRLILGADLLVCTNDADLVASTIDSALIDGGKAFILGADKYTRFGVQNFPDACRSLGLKVTVHEDLLGSDFAAEEVDGEMQQQQQQQLMDELELGGYNQRASTMAHDFTLFKITKPIAKSA
jgi:predicted nicotinamide N-methyase